MIKGVGSKTRLYITTQFEFHQSLLDRFLGKSSFDLAKHIAEGHFIPYIKFYLSRHEEKEAKVSEKIIMEEEGDINQLVNKFREIIKTLELGLVKISNDNLVCSFLIVNGDIKNAVCRTGKEEKEGGDALATLLFVTGKAKLVVKELSFKEYLSQIA